MEEQGVEEPEEAREHSQHPGRRLPGGEGGGEGGEEGGAEGGGRGGRGGAGHREQAGEEELEEAECAEVLVKEV